MSTGKNAKWYRNVQKWLRSNNCFLELWVCKVFEIREWIKRQCFNCLPYPASLSSIPNFLLHQRFKWRQSFTYKILHHLSLFSLSAKSHVWVSPYGIATYCSSNCSLWENLLKHHFPCLHGTFSSFLSIISCRLILFFFFKSQGVLYDLFECLYSYMDGANLSAIPIYFISPVADSSLAYSNIFAEW